jgi:hypothetical protein
MTIKRQEPLSKWMARRILLCPKHLWDSYINESSPLRRTPQIILNQAPGNDRTLLALVAICDLDVIQFDFSLSTWDAQGGALHGAAGGVYAFKKAGWAWRLEQGLCRLTQAG